MFPPEPLPQHPYTIDKAIARIEGWYVVGDEPNRPQRNNNPGDLDYAPWQRAHGATLEVDPYSRPRFACFPTPADGKNALRALLSGSLYSELCVRDAVNRYAPPSENNTVDYVAMVCDLCDCEPTALVKELL